MRSTFFVVLTILVTIAVGCRRSNPPVSEDGVGKEIAKAPPASKPVPRTGKQSERVALYKAPTTPPAATVGKAEAPSLPPPQTVEKPAPQPAAPPPPAVTPAPANDVQLAAAVQAQPPERVPLTKKKDDNPPMPPITHFGGKTLRQWKAELTHPDDPGKRAGAIAAIVQFGDDAAECVPLLLQRLQDPDVSPRAKALVALRFIGYDKKDTARIVQAIAGRLDPVRERQAVIRLEATTTLMRFLEENADSAISIPSLIIPALIKGLQDRDSWEIRHNCAFLLWRAGADPKNGPDARAIQAMLDRLPSRESYAVKLEILQGLGAMGRPSEPTLLARLIKDLDAASRSSNRALAVWAYAALVAMQDGNAAEGSLVAITKLLRNDNLEIRVQAAQALGALGQRAKGKVPNLLDMLRDKEPGAVGAACMALVGIGDKDTKVINTLIDLAQHKDTSRAAPAIMALFQMKATSPGVLKIFDRMLEDKDLHIGLRGMIEFGLKEMKKK